MSLKPETKFIAKVHKLLPAWLYHVKMANPFVGGIPDQWYSGTKADLWVEYKWVEKTPTKPFTPKLSALQLIWLGNRCREGRNVVVIVGFPDGGCIFTNWAWEHSVTVTPRATKTTEEIAQFIINQTMRLP